MENKKTFKVLITTTFRKTYDVEAASEEEALDMVNSDPDYFYAATDTLDFDSEASIVPERKTKKFDYYEVYLQNGDNEYDNYSIIIKRPYGAPHPHKNGVKRLLLRNNKLEPGYHIEWISEYDNSQCEFDKRGALLYE